MGAAFAADPDPSCAPRRVARARPKGYNRRVKSSGRAGTVAVEIRSVFRAELVGPHGGPLPLALHLDAVLVAAMGTVPGVVPAPGQLARQLVTHCTREGFRCLVAFVTTEPRVPARPWPMGSGPASSAPAPRPVGFAYGYTGRRGQWWTEQVARHMDEAAARAWLDGHFELVELHVHPAYHSRGIGGLLHDRLLQDLPHRRALLSTRQGPTIALALYRSRGWEVVAGPMYFDGAPDPYLILGKRLAPPSPSPAEPRPATAG